MMLKWLIHTSHQRYYEGLGFRHGLHCILGKTASISRYTSVFGSETRYNSENN